MDKTSEVSIRDFFQKLVVSCLESRDVPEIPSELSVDTIIELATKNQMQYLLLYPLLKMDIEQEKKASISDILKLSTFRTFTQMISIKEIADSFEKEGIRHQFLKGAILKRLYPSPEMREMSDIDIIVYDESLTRASNTLQNLGYVCEGLVKHHMIFTSPIGVHVEVHWCLFDQNVDYDNYIFFKDDFESVKVSDKNYTYEFTIENFYVYMIAHIAKHFFETGCGIRNLVDVYVYYSKYGDSMNIDLVNKELKECGIAELEEHIRKLAFIWMENKEFSIFYENLFDYMLFSGIYGNSENGVWSQLAKDTKDGCGLTLVHYYFPSYKFMKERFAWLSKYPFFLPLAWIIRAMEGITSKQGEKHAKKIMNSDRNEIKKMLEIYHNMNLDFRRKSYEKE